ncbi:hypothetical protein [Cryobacterium sp. TMT4-31]|uniref:DUF7002 family protein n=1 Tax=Cryobacterium sp. TMT4-31 TaxID=1259259 RepID=UPI001069DD4E|nr:hypothetical protein [Cryobacterium sp. TMT4-31]TFC86497.1 hypothetical protein E3T19_14405 [Cryobacterium sp. TMT4-31]
METEELIERYPKLYHMATAGSWQLIKASGLWTTEQIVATSGLDALEADRMLSQKREHSVALAHPLLGEITVRDQKPLRMSFLEASLVDVTPAEWLATLNNRVFFWLHMDRLTRLLNARHYRTMEQDVLTIDTRSLVEAHGERVRLSPMNSGATLFPNPPMRGSNTFSTIGNYPYEERRKGRVPSDAVVELAVVNGVHDLADHVTSVHRWRGATQLYELEL